MKSIFDNMSDEEFEDLLNEFGFNFEKVEKGQGGIIYKGQKYSTYEEYEKALNKEGELL